MRYLAILFLLNFTISNTCYSQVKSYSSLEELTFYSDIMINALEAGSRIRAADKFNELFRDYIEDANNEVNKASFKYISVQESPDSLFTLVSWPIEKATKTFDFKAYLLFKDNSIIEFNRQGALNLESAYASYTNADWYGCLYYKIQMLEPNKYLLFGFDPNGLYDNQKLVDVLTINEGQISLGAEIFEDKNSIDTYLNRLILSYASDASVNLNFNENMGMIIHDHLESRMGLQAGQGVTSLPDGTYEGYIYQEGQWKYKEKIFDHIYETAPRPKPVFNNNSNRNTDPLNGKSK